MSYYRLYFMDTFFGHIERFEDFDAGDDFSAVSLAKSKEGPLALELWCADRKVARLEPVDLASQLLATRRKSKAVKAQVQPATDDAEAIQQANRSA